MLLFTLYLLLAMAWLHLRSGWQRHLPAGHWLLWVLLARVAAGCWFGWYYRGIPDIDTWYYHEEGLKYYTLLKQDPLAFLRKDVLDHGYAGSVWHNALSSSQSFFNDLQQNLVIKWCAVLNLLSGGHYYTNVLLTNVATTWGLWAGFRWWRRCFPAWPLATWLVLGLYPPMLHFTSPLMKDGLCMALLFATFFWWGNEDRPLLLRCAMVMLLAGLMVLLRPAMGLALAPALVLTLPRARQWVQARVLLTAGGFVLAVITVFAATGWLAGGANLPAALAGRQQAFQALAGGSRLTTDLLWPTLEGYVAMLPQAVRHLWLSPLPHEIEGWGGVAAALFTLVALAAWMVASLDKWLVLPAQRVLLFWVLSMALLQYLLIGFTVPFLGALLRYRALWETLVVLLAVHMILERKKASRRGEEFLGK